MNREIDISGILHSIRVPTLIIHLTGDTLVSVQGSRELAAGIPDARLVEIPGIDHLLLQSSVVLSEPGATITAGAVLSSRQTDGRTGRAKNIGG